MALVATYGNTNAYNINIWDMPGGGYYAVLNDGATPVFQRRNNASGQDLYATGGATSSWLLDHFASFAYNAGTKTVTLSGSADTVGGVTFTRQETYKFVDAYVVEDTWQVSVSSTGQVNMSNWNYYTTRNAVWDINNSNFGNNTSWNALGLGLQMTVGGSIYGVIADNDINNLNCFFKRSNFSASGISVLAASATWFVPGDSGSVTVAAGTPFTLKQWFFKSKPTQYDFMLQSQMAVALAKGYSGTMWQKILKVTAYLNQGLMPDLVGFKSIAVNKYSVTNPPFNAQFARDAWWQSMAVSSSLEQNAIAVWESKQNASGQIPTWVGQNINFTQDESTLFHVIRAYYDSAVRGLTISNTVITNCMTYIATRVVSNYFNAPAPGWLDTWQDVSNLPMAYNQGLYCVALKCAQALGQSVTNGQITNAIAQYSALYNSTGKYIAMGSGAKESGVMCPDALTGEALSIFLFNQKMLSDQIVTDHVKTFRSKALTPWGLKSVCNSDGSYCDVSLFGQSPGTPQGGYANGGSRYLYDHLAYYAAFYHGLAAAHAWDKSLETIQTSVAPVSHEYMPLTVDAASAVGTVPGDDPGSSKAMAWNVAGLVIKIPITLKHTALREWPLPITFS